MPTTKTVRPTLAHEALAAYVLAQRMLPLLDTRRVKPERIQAELDALGQRIAAMLGCKKEDLTREKGEKNGRK